MDNPRCCELKERLHLLQEGFSFEEKASSLACASAELLFHRVDERGHETDEEKLEHLNQISEKFRNAFMHKVHEMMEEHW